MAKAIKRLSLTILLLGLLAGRAQAQTVNAASCNESDVLVAVTAAAAGGQVNIPAGTCTWTLPLAVAKNISIVGAGASALTIFDNAGSNAELIHWAGAYGTPGCASQTAVCFRLSGLTIKPYTGSARLFSLVGLLGTCTTTWCPNIRVDDVTFDGFTTANFQLPSFIRTDNVFGVVDHNHFISTDDGVVAVNASLSAYLGLGTYGDNSWAKPDSYGSGAALYFESNTMDSGTSYDCDAPPSGGTMGGCRVVVRFNTFSNVNIGGAMQSHGTESGQRSRGMRQAEIYGNTINCARSGGCAADAGWARSGAILAFGNHSTVSGSAFYSADIGVEFARGGFSFPPWGVCDGMGPWDKNDGVVYASGTATASGTNLTDSRKSWATNQWYGYSFYNVTQNWGAEILSNTATSATSVGSSGYGTHTWNVGDSYQILRATICIDQPGRGAGTLLSGTTPSPTGWVNEALDAMYVLGDTTTSAWTQGSFSTHTYPTPSLAENRDFYVEASQKAQSSATSPFNGTSGTGYGILANRPTTCTTGVAYFATDQGSWNTSQSSFPNQSFSQGVIYFCTAANTWGSFYTPYRYPHPLMSGSGGSTQPPDPPSGLAATVQ